jgi:hypothetical protein
MFQSARGGGEAAQRNGPSAGGELRPSYPGCVPGGPAQFHHNTNPVAPGGLFFQNKPRSAVLRPCCAERFVMFGNPLISLGPTVNGLQHETDQKNGDETARNPYFTGLTATKYPRPANPRR